MTATPPRRFDEGCGPVVLLTIRRGPHSGRTRAYCTCGWERTYKSKRKAQKREAEHLALANGAPPQKAETP